MLPSFRPSRPTTKFSGGRSAILSLPGIFSSLALISCVLHLPSFLATAPWSPQLPATARTREELSLSRIAEIKIRIMETNSVGGTRKTRMQDHTQATADMIRGCLLTSALQTRVFLHSFCVSEIKPNLTSQCPAVEKVASPR